MKFTPNPAALALCLVLAACGGSGDEAGEAGAPEPAATETATTSALETPEAGATPSETPSASPTPTPTPTVAAAPAAAATAPAAFAVCSACHSVAPGENGIGPSLARIWGEKAGAVPGYDFSDAMKSSGLTWNQATLDRYLADPKGVVPGTKMGFAGLKDAAKRQEVIAYLRTVK